MSYLFDFSDGDKVRPCWGCCWQPPAIRDPLLSPPLHAIPCSLAGRDPAAPLALLLRPHRGGHTQAALLRRGHRPAPSQHGGDPAAACHPPATKPLAQCGHSLVAPAQVTAPPRGLLCPQDTGKLRIGTYTGPLQHCAVYSGGECPAGLRGGAGTRQHHALMCGWHRLLGRGV